MIPHAPKPSTHKCKSPHPREKLLPNPKTRFVGPQYRVKYADLLPDGFSGHWLLVVAALSGDRRGPCHALQTLQCQGLLPSPQPSWQGATSHSHGARLQGRGKTSLRWGRKRISISYHTGCRLRHGELSGKTMAPSSLSSRSRQAMLGNAEAQPVKAPQLHQLSPPCPRPASSSPWGWLLPPHHAPERDMPTTMGPAHLSNRGTGLQGNSQLSARQTDGQTAQDEPPPSAELGHIPGTRGIKPPRCLHSPVCPQAGQGQSRVRVSSCVPSATW